VTDLAGHSVWRRDGVVVVGITGEIDVSNAEALELAIAAEVDNEAAGLVLDLAGLAFMDSSGVHLLFSLAERLRHRGFGFAIVLPELTPPRRVLELSGPRPAHWIHTTEEAAIAAVLAGA
jgi:anti-anti-sigma factor